MTTEEIIELSEYAKKQYLSIESLYLAKSKELNILTEQVDKLTAECNELKRALGGYFEVRRYYDNQLKRSNDDK